MPWFKEDMYKYIKIIIKQEEYRIECKLNKIIDTLAWWIPLRKWRNNFRDKFK